MMPCRYLMVQMMIGCQERTTSSRRILEKPDQIPHQHRTKSVAPGTLSPDTVLSLRSGPAKKAHRVYGKELAPISTEKHLGVVVNGKL